MSQKIALLVSNDPLCRRFAKTVVNENPQANICIVLVKTPDLRRTIRLIKKGRAPLLWVIYEVLASLHLSWKFRAETWPSKPFSASSSLELSELLQKLDITTCLAFRFGFIIPKDLLGKFKIFNIHCASLPQYAGIASIWRALKDKSYDQCATCHTMAPEVDAGKTIYTNPYYLNPKLSYFKNMCRAYEAGIEMAPTVLAQINVSGTASI